jgi:predicted GNAT family N-acyltransferase
VIVRSADYAKDFAAIRAIRTAVFIDEQGVDRTLEFDDRDPLCLHLLALEGAEPIGTARLDVEYGGKIGRLAVLATHRRRGVGAALMAQLHALARARGLPRLWCHAQLSAVPFYERLGYTASGTVFVEADIDHVRMDASLR